MTHLNSSHIVLRGRNRTVKLRRSLFWDVDPDAIDLNRHRKLILERVFSRGDLEEFKQVNRYYSEKEIKDAVLNIKCFDRRTINFLSKTYHVNPSDLSCCNDKR